MLHNVVSHLESPLSQFCFRISSFGDQRSFSAGLLDSLPRRFRLLRAAFILLHVCCGWSVCDFSLIWYNPKTCGWGERWWREFRIILSKIRDQPYSVEVAVMSEQLTTKNNNEIIINSAGDQPSRAQHRMRHSSTRSAPSTWLILLFHRHHVAMLRICFKLTP